MSETYLSSITAEEAVARMVNAGVIPNGSSLKEMLSIATEDAQIEYDNAKHDDLPEDLIESSRISLDVCKARQLLAHHLLEDFDNECCSTDDSMLVTTKDMTSRYRYTLESVTTWAALKHSIFIDEWMVEHCKTLSKWLLPTEISWEDMEIRIRKGNIVTYFYDGTEWDSKAFKDINLLDIKKHEPNYQAGILIGLSIGEKFPPGRIAEAKHKTAISKLRFSLKRLTGIKADPFFSFNETDGWKPRFKITNDIKIADERAKNNTLHVGYKDGLEHGNDIDE